MGLQSLSGFGRVGFQITGRGLENFKRDIQNCIIANNNPDSVLRIIGARMKKAIQDNIKRQEQADGTAWPPLSDVTIELRRKGPRKGKPDIPLRDSGRLFNDIAYQVSGKEVAAGTNTEYAPTHQFGQTGSGGWHGVKVDGKWVGEAVNDIPAREFVYLNDKQVEDIVNTLTDRLIVSAFGRI